MNSNYNPTLGIITTEMQPHEAEIITAALPFLRNELMKHPACKADCDEIIMMTVDLTDAIIMSKEDKHIDPCFCEAVTDMIRNKKPILKSSEEQTLWETIKEIVRPRFTTSDFETAIEASRFKIDKQTFEYKKRNYPDRVTAIIRPDYNKNAVVKAHWDCYGKCYSPFGTRLKEYDLRRPTDKTEYTAKAVSESMILALIVILITSII